MTTESVLSKNCIDESLTLKKAVEALNQGRAILLLDSDQREDEGDLVIAAEKITAESMNFLIKNGSGIVCLAMPKSHLEKLGLPLMVPEAHDSNTAFTVSIEAKTGVTTGVCAKDRAHTIKVAVADDATGSHLTKPGHVFPIAAKEQGVFDRMGHTEGSVDLMRIAGLKPAAVLCELMDDDGHPPKMKERLILANKLDLVVVSIEEIFFHRLKNLQIDLKKSLVGSNFGPIFWQSFKILGQEIDIFSAKERSSKPTRLHIIDGSNLKNRFLAQVLSNNPDDPLAMAFKLLKDESYMVIMTSFTSFEEKSHELSMRTHALICKALYELNIKNFISEDLSLKRIAKDFGLTAQER